MHRGAVAEIDLKAVSGNLRIVNGIAGSKRQVIAVVKADAYGHGAAEVSGRLADEGVSCLAVAYTEEAVALRNAGIHARILVLFDKADAAAFFNHDLMPVIYDIHTAKRFSREASRRNRPLNVHIKIDTGMGRLGFNSENAVKDIIAISGMSHINIAGLMSHFSEADVADRDCAAAQIKIFKDIREKLPHGLKSRLLCHIANSAAVLLFKDAGFDAVRPGLMLYGCSPLNGSGPSGSSAKGLRPAMKVRTSILSLRKVRKGASISYGRTFVTKKESLIAVLPVGYADGYSRMFSNNAFVLVRGNRAPVIGRVCMDLTMVDVTGLEGVREDDEVVLLGKQGKAEVTVREAAAWAGTVPYEIFTSIGNRSKREYKGLRTTEAQRGGSGEK